MKITSYIFSIGIFFVLSVGISHAASLHVAPGTGVYSAGGTFTARVTINTTGQKVNAAEGTLSFNPRELSVVSVTRGGSIFNLWTEEPSFSNAAGTISFGGGSPTGYSGGNGNVMSVTFRAVAAGSPKVQFTGGSVLAADGLGTNVLTSMTGGSYTVNAPTENPQPEYIAPANTPGLPLVTSSSHPNPDKWYQKKTADLAWAIPNGVISVRTLLDQAPGTIPTIVYDEPITSRVIEDLPEGVSYFHIQFRNGDGWGKVAHYRLGVDTEPPKSFTISEPEDQNPTVREKTVQFTFEDISPVTGYRIQIDGSDKWIEYTDDAEVGKYTLPVLDPGHHTMVVEAFDSAGNMSVATYGFDIASFDRPVFTEYPTRINTEVIPVLRGSTRPESSVAITVRGSRDQESVYEVKSDSDGQFIFIPDSTFDRGVYDIFAIATDAYGAKSDPSETLRIIVEEPGYIKVGNFVVSVLSVLIPLIALLLLCVFGVWYLWHRLRNWQRYVLKETKEAEKQLAIEFDTITTNLKVQVEKLKESRRGKLTKAEIALIDGIRTDIASAEQRIKKEISDIDDVVE